MRVCVPCVCMHVYEVIEGEPWLWFAYVCVRVCVLGLPLVFNEYPYYFCAARAGEDIRTHGKSTFIVCELFCGNV